MSILEQGITAPVTVAERFQVFYCIQCSHDHPYLAVWISPNPSEVGTGTSSSLEIPGSSSRDQKDLNFVLSVLQKAHFAPISDILPFTLIHKVGEDIGI